MKTRKLKIEEHWQDNKYKEVSSSRIRLKGKWLEEAGFNSGGSVVVKIIEPGRILIESEDKNG